MSQHTPGPWKYHLGRGENPRFHIQDSGGYQIASTTELVRHKQAHEENAMREANARLIAAAPELLHAVELAHVELSKMGCDCEDSPVHCPVCACRVAIAKAKGETISKEPLPKGVPMSVWLKGGAV